MQSYFILFTLPLIIFSSKLFSNKILHKTQKFCVDCKFYIPHNDIFGFGGRNEFGKCKLYYEVTDDKSDFLVTGVNKPYIIEYKYCSICRNNDNLCGEEGKKYEKK